MNPRYIRILCAWLTGGTLLLSGGLAIAQETGKAQPQAAPGQDSKATGGNGTASAKDAKEEPDTLILSDTLHYDDAKRESVFTGNVILTRGLMKLTADKLSMHEDADGFQYGTATAAKGKLVHIRQENPAKFEVIEAEGLRAEYDGKKEEIEVIGQAIITRYVCGKPFDNIKGERIIYHQKTDTYEAFSGPNSAAQGGRVRSLALPRAKSDAAAAECARKSGKSG
ncbi:lipopolysaccharide transport periplasmic protein LptA [Allopusillimonas soli]|uniref:Lipopolysaccharide export system protein LptA n=1 Tax=Allopusillimonas soli TaxID=659016 RepID=A0A853FCB6_9BURK|nr:lipopolysaccharide transport periplasmic protein LptA [Allopusillimonas soli]NYT37577.1 lipopolysaccharide transport periplasmic protein LptA [Allopusillimonas soli]TEA74459.1 lipopolysaccharide transport periplasmic protein LptA [Allopusillimonas soli]